MKKNDKIIVSLYGELLEDNLPSQIASGFEWAQGIFEDYGLAVTGANCKCRQGEALKPYKAYNFKAAKKRFLAEIEAGNLEYLSIDHLPSDPRAAVATDWLLYFHIERNIKKDLCSCQIGVDVDLFRSAGTTLERLLDVSNRMRSILAAGYGFATCMPRDRMPAGYAIGLGCSPGLSMDSIIWDANAWRQNGGTTYASRLRNVYAINFVSREHLQQSVGDQTLRDWILADRGRGTLAEWEGNLSLWSLLDGNDLVHALDWDARRVAEARASLEAHNIFPWQEYIARQRQRAPNRPPQGGANEAKPSRSGTFVSDDR